MELSGIIFSYDDEQLRVTYEQFCRDQYAVYDVGRISPEGYELWQPHNWPVTTTNHLTPHLAIYLGHKMVSVFV